MSGFPRMKLQYVLERKTARHLENELEGKEGLAMQFMILLQ
jgi:hypothetical protein